MRTEKRKGETPGGGAPPFVAKGSRTKIIFASRIKKAVDAHSMEERLFFVKREYYRHTLQTAD